MNAKLKTLLKVAAAIVIPGAGIYLVATAIMKDVEERKEFREYIRKTYGEDSEYVDRYQ